MLPLTECQIGCNEMWEAGRPSYEVPARSNYVFFCKRPDTMAPKLGHCVLSGPRIGLTAMARIVGLTVWQMSRRETS